MPKHLKLIFLFAWVGILFLSGCATVGEFPETPTPSSQKGAYHKVQKGETLWRIAQNYGVNLEDLRRANRIPDAAVVEVGQLLRIPGAEAEKPIVSAPSDSNSKEFAWPVEGRIVNYFGERKNGVTSKGIRIAVSSGEKITASRTGKVVFADYLTGYAYTAIIDHADGYNSVYSYNSRLLVKNGDHVSKGDPLAEVGPDGVLLFQIRRNTVAENPLYFLQKM